MVTDEIFDGGKGLEQASLSALRGSLTAFRCHAKLDSDYSCVVVLLHNFSHIDALCELVLCLVSQYCYIV